MRFKSVILILATLCLIALPVFAQEASNAGQMVVEIKYEQVNPSDGVKYSFKRLSEKLKLFFLSLLPSAKTEYYETLMDRRLAELKYIIEKKQMHKFENTTIRYFTTAGLLTSEVKNAAKEKKDKVRKLLESHLPVLEKLMTTFDSSTAEWRFVKQDIDSLQIYIEALR